MPTLSFSAPSSKLTPQLSFAFLITFLFPWPMNPPVPPHLPLKNSVPPTTPPGREKWRPSCAQSASGLLSVVLRSALMTPSPTFRLSGTLELTRLQDNSIFHFLQSRGLILRLSRMTLHRSGPLWSLSTSNSALKLASMLGMTSSLLGRNRTHLLPPSLLGLRTLCPKSKFASAATTIPLDFDLWHRRLVHHHLADVKALLNRNLVTGMTMDLKTAPDPICEPCLTGKMHANPFPSSSWRATRPLELVHSNVHNVDVK